MKINYEGMKGVKMLFQLNAEENKCTHVYCNTHTFMRKNETKYMSGKTRVSTKS